MIILWIIYILGVIVNFLFISYLELESSGELTIMDLGFFMIISGLSWISLLVGLLILYGDEVVVFKKK